jgi:F-type H+-transporting ATPase subunit delta
MKITAKQYAQALFEATVDKKASQTDKLVESFLGILIKNRDFKKAEEIIERFRKISLKAAGVVEADIIAARKLDKTVVKVLTSHIAKLTGATSVMVNEQVNPEILGGVVALYEDKILDGSIKSRLSELKNEIIK